MHATIRTMEQHSNCHLTKTRRLGASTITITRTVTLILASSLHVAHAQELNLPVQLQNYNHNHNHNQSNRNITEITNTNADTRAITNINTWCNTDYCRDGRTCAEPQCSGCQFACADQSQCPRNQNHDLAEITCGAWCTVDECGTSSCASCQLCMAKPNANDGLCPLGTFEDVTPDLFRHDAAYWYSPTHAGHPYMHESSPMFVDLNGDGIPDYFNSLHGHRIESSDGEIVDRFEVAFMMDDNGDVDVDGDDNGQRNDIDNDVFENYDGSALKKPYLVPAPHRIIYEDDPARYTSEQVHFIDPHGQNIVDLDGDGILDLYIASGGFSGMASPIPEAFDNFLFFGEKDPDTGDLFFRGGRTVAEKAGVNMRNGRGRVNHMLDVNGDGLIDIFTQQSRRMDNEVAPGILLINQGNRKWKEDRSMMEFANTMIVTDADGDGFANEIMINRGFCFPQRRGPGVDPRYPSLGKFEGMEEFCASRPVGTTAIYKFNDKTQKMEEISPIYTNVGSDEDYQPPCCGHDLFDGENECSALSIAAVDIDNDKIADHVLLYSQKLVFYFSSDRQVGELPIEKKYQGLVLELPEFCGMGESVRIVDLNNDGDVNIIVLCRNPGTMAIYGRGANRKDWVLQDRCNGNGSLGQMNEKSLMIPDMDELFPKTENCNSIKQKHLKKMCKKYKDKTLEIKRITTGLTLADINNDGFTDAVVSNNFGYLRFFHNIPSEASRDNKFIAFKLVGDGVKNNVHGIGATLILRSRNSNREVKTQFREVSFYQHTSDKKGYQDERIIFGLGKEHTVNRLTVKWSNGKIQAVNLDHWKFSSSMVPIIIEDRDEKEYFRIQNPVRTRSGEFLCFSAGQLKQWKHIRTISCSSDPSERQQFRLDPKGRLRNRRFPNYCLAPVGDVVNVLTELQLRVCRKVKSSWIKKGDGSVTISGSNFGISVTQSIENSIPFLHDTRESKFQHIWNFKKVG